MFCPKTFVLAYWEKTQCENQQLFDGIIDITLFDAVEGLDYWLSSFYLSTPAPKNDDVIYGRPFSWSNVILVSLVTPYVICMPTQITTAHISTAFPDVSTLKYYLTLIKPNITHTW